MLDELSWFELLEWMEFADLEPFDEERADMRAGSICATIANVNRDPKKRAAAFTAADFALSFGDKQRPRQTWQQQKAIGQLLVGAFNNVAPRKRVS